MKSALSFAKVSRVPTTTTTANVLGGRGGGGAPLVQSWPVSRSAGVRSFNCNRSLTTMTAASATRCHDQRRHSCALPRLPIGVSIPVSGLFRVERRHASSASEAAAAPAGAAEQATQLNRTALYDLHLEHGGKMVPFGGFLMPVQYADLSVGESHKWTREKASVFDVGHMVQHIISGPGAASFLETVTPLSTTSLQQHHSSLSCLLHPVTGGIVDDTVITRLGPQLFYVVTNAACKEKDLAYLKEQLAAFKSSEKSQEDAVEWTVRDTWGLAALQGPLSAPVLQNVLQAAGADVPLEPLLFGQCIEVSVHVPGTAESMILISRAGYTGEDGFEIAIPPSLTEPFVRHLLQAGGPDRVRMAGLGARDSLRLEAGMCLYGHDLDDSTTPVEAGLSWVIGKDRRTGGGFHGAETILRQLRPAKEGGSGVERRRVGLIVEGAPAREGVQIVTATTNDHPEEEIIGKITSGCPSPTMGKNIAMGYIKSGHHKAGTEVAVVVRGRKRRAQVVKMPFVQSRYWKGELKEKVKTGTAPA